MTALARFDHTFTAMGSPCEICLYAHDQAAATAALQCVLADLARLEQRYSRYRADSLLSAINRTAQSGGSIDIDDETASLFDYAATCFLESNGLFDITSGILRRVWHRNRTALPTAEELQPLLARIGWEKMTRRGRCLTFPAGMEIDLGGIVKEYAADRAATLCQQAGIVHGILNLGGDIRVIGPHPDGSPWQIGIRHPRQRQGILGHIALLQGAVTTSGDYERCLVLDGQRYGHILHPRTGWPVRHLASVTVVADFCVVAGSASTIALLLEDAGPRWLEQMGLQHLWVDLAGNSGGNLLRFPTDGAADVPP